MPARARRSRQRSIRALFALGLIVPVVSLLALWVFGAGVTVPRAGAERDFTAASRLYSGPAQALSSALTTEQLLVATRLSAGRHAPLGPPQAQFQATDKAAASFLAAARADRAVIPAGARPALRSLESLLAGRAAVRADAQARRLSALATVQAYGAILTAVVGFDGHLLVAADASLSRQAAATVEADHGVALASSEIALASGSVTAGGAMSTPERVLFAQDAAGARLLLTDALAVLNPDLGSGYRRVKTSAGYQAFTTAEDQIMASVGEPGLVPVDTAALAASAAPLSTGYQAAQQQDAAGLATLAAQASDRATLAAALVAGLGLVVLLLSVVLAIWLWWRIVGEVTRLQVAAMTLADERLPLLAGRHAGADAAGPVGAASRPAGRIREITQASAALSAAQQLVLQAAASQDLLRSLVSQFVRNLGLRSHALAQRQLRLLAVIQRGAGDPQTLAGLAAVGQLSTQLQRQADGLLVLSGSAPSRSGQVPVRIGDLLRAATAEVDDGSRIAVVSDSMDAVTAEAVADVLHLITELVENAAQHTPPLAEVAVRVGRVGRGLVVEVEDHGPGFAAEGLQSANALLADPPEIGLVAGDGLGLVVVAQLAARHGMTVTLRGSPTGGTTAIVLLPHAILITGDVRDTIFDGSLPRIDALMPPPVSPPPVAFPPVAFPPVASPPVASPPDPFPPDPFSL
ncbi:MAG: ATP-binding protein, partial [Streptosporangiaceae bacterium]